MKNSLGNKVNLVIKQEFMVEKKSGLPGKYKVAKLQMPPLKIRLNK